MTEVRIERFDASYYGVTAARSHELDEALSALVGGGLESALASGGWATVPALQHAWAVCVPSVEVEVILGDRGVSDCADAWATAVVDALGTRVERVASRAGDESTSRPSEAESEDGPDAVVFETRGAALADLVRRVALGDQRRAWAWRLCGLVPDGDGPVGPGDVAAALRVLPLLVPDVLREVGPTLVDRVLDPDEVAALGVLVASCAGLRRRSGADAGAQRRVEPAVLAAVPPRARSALVGSDPSGVSVWGTAVLATLVATPRRSTDPEFVAVVAEALTQPAGPARSTPRGATPTDVRGDGTPPTQEDETRTGAVEPYRALSQPGGENDTAPANVEESGEGVTSEWGGVWFLAHGLAVTGLVERQSSAEAMVALVATFTGAPRDDPSVQLLCGADPERDGRGDTEDPTERVTEEEMDGLGAWLARRAGGRLVDRPADELWRRRATVHVLPGEVVVDLALDEMDPVVRAAGLDLDPGWVGWLGTSVRFRYA